MSAGRWGGAVGSGIVPEPVFREWVWISSALASAIESGELHAVEALIRRHPELVNHPDWTPPPIHCTVLWNQPEIAEFLLDHGADLEMLDPDRQTTPLRSAIMYCRTEMIPLLLTRGANFGPVGENGPSALELARNAANGAFEEYADLPPRTAYLEVIRILQQCGITS